MAMNRFFKNVALFAIPGIAATTLTHPFEHAQVGRQEYPKLITIKDAGGIKITKRNPARYAKLEFPGVKPIEYDRGSSWQHFLSRVPKGLAGGATSVYLGIRLKNMKYFR